MTSSLIYLWAERVRTSITVAFTRSRAAAYLRRLSASAPPGNTRMFNAGLVVVVAAIVHLAITDYGRGWMTLIVPAIAAAAAVLAMLMARRTEPPAIE